MKNIIVIWSGAVVDIPAGWALCDGNNGTPILTDKFIVGAGGSFAPGTDNATNVTGGVNMHYYALCYIMKL